MDEKGRARREQVRMRAAAMFADGASAADVATALEVSLKTAHQWRRAWTCGGAAALESKGRPGPGRLLSDAQVARLLARLEQGPAAAGYVEDQRWTLARIATLIGGMFHRRVSLQTVSVLLHRADWTPQQPVHRAAERDEAAIAAWRRHQWPAVKGSRAGWARGSASKTSAA